MCVLIKVDHDERRKIIDACTTIYLQNDIIIKVGIVKSDDVKKYWQLV